ncbi:hypothetical protein Desti_5319 [Desulfomonile tiedjei DSM 6799]|uniref:Uncharacterized protein n=1 Tax=Desulfomonile tiedjei (strain ATCC 49306 / DSM 6799 / DCB-1) TaxID=706587 RepID=I4CEB7_DESTA|nr:hypothetical protein Desti_5319 [Desulfomonile tiedjei DSM 6799]
MFVRRSLLYRFHSICRQPFAAWQRGLLYGAVTQAQLNRQRRTVRQAVLFIAIIENSDGLRFTSSSPIRIPLE